MAAIENHQNDLAVSGNTGCGSGCSVAACGSSDFAVSEDDRRAADRFLNICLIGCPLSTGADSGGAVVQDRKEATVVIGVIDHTVHNQAARGLAGGHIVEVTVDTADDIEVLNILITVGIGVYLHSRCDLIGHSCSTPTL